MSPLGAATENDFTPAAQTAAAEAAVELTASNMENGGHGTFGANGAKVAAKLDEGKEEKGKEQPDQAKKAAKQPAVPYYQLFKYADKLDVLLVIGGTIAAIVEGAALPVFFVFFGKLINSLGTYYDQPLILADKVNKYSLYFVYVGLVVLVSSYFDVSLWMWTGERQSSRIRSKYLRAILRQDVGYFDVGTSSGEVVSRVNDDTLLVQDAVGEKVGNYLKNMATFVAGFIVGFTQVWQLTLVLFAVIPLLATPGMLYARTLKGLSSQGAEAYADAGRIVEESLSAVRTVYSFAAEEKTQTAYEVALQKTYKLGLKASLAKGLALGAQAVLFFAWALMFWYGSVLVANGDANGGKILSTAFAVIIGGLSLGQAVPNLKNFAEGCTAAHKIFQMIDRIPAIDSEDLSGKKLDSVEGNIELRNVSFVYPARPDVPIFQRFSLAIPAGRHVALVGSSGSGKSTVIQLLERFYDPTGGDIFLDGHNIKSLQLKWLRQQYGLVSQEPALFATSIKENILYGKENATQEEVENAARAANAHSFISSLPQGYDTQVGDRGVQLSGGQKQRVAIARAILKQPKILLLDEATSALDSESEHVVQEALDRLMVGRTTVVIAHRLSTIRDADVIAVVQKGEIVEQGAHEDLIASGGAYASLVKLQEIREDHDEEELVDGSPGLDSPVKSFKTQTSGLSAQRSGLGQQRSGLGQQRSGLGQQRSGLGMQRSGLGDEEAGDQDQKVAGKAPRPSFWRLLALNKPEWPYMLLGTVGAVAAGLVNPFWALIVSTVTSVYYNTDIDEMKDDVKRYCYIFIGLGGGAMLAYCTEHFCYGAVGEALTKRVRALMLKTLLRQEVAFFDRDENSPGALAARVGTDATYVRAVVGDRMYLIVQALTGILASIIIGLVLEWKLALVMLATFPLLTLGAVMENVVLRGFSDQNAKAQESASQVAAGAVGNIRTVSAFSAEDKVLALFNEKLEVPRKLSFRRGQTSGLGLGLSQFFLYASWALALWYGTQLVKNDGASFDDVLKVFLVIVSVGFGVAEAASLAPDVAKGGTATESVFEVVDRRTEIDADANANNKLDKLEGAIELRDVTFSYPTRPDVVIFKNFSLKVKPGLTVALVGQSGSGKSTIISLIQRFYAPASGRILIDGKDISTLHLKTLRSQIGLVSQEPTLFSGTIKSNILYGKSNATEAEIVEAARAANAHNFISALPDGYDTHVGEKGVQLSGGQKQRIAIARAAIKSPRILLLDEATSALDTESERVVQEALDRLMVGRTTLVIAHRLSTVRHADVIAVVQEGAIVEQGSHDQLIAKGEGGAYYSLVNIQKKGPV